MPDPALDPATARELRRAAAAVAALAEAVLEGRVSLDAQYPYPTAVVPHRLQIVVRRRPDPEDPA